MNLIFSVVLSLAFNLPAGASNHVTPSKTSPVYQEQFLPVFQFANESKCTLSPCHGLNVSCVKNGNVACTMMYALGDNCRSFVRCEERGGECVMIKDPKFDTCKACIERCTSKSTDRPSEAFECEARCLGN